MAAIRLALSALRLLTTAMSPLSMNASAALTAASKLPPGIVAQIEDKADQLVAGLLPQILDRRGELRRASRRRTRPAGYSRYRPPSSREVDGLERCRAARLTLTSIGLLAAAAHHQRDLAAGRAAQFLLDLRQGQVVGRVLVDREDHVAGLDLGLGGRRAVARRDDLDAGCCRSSATSPVEALSSGGCGSAAPCTRSRSGRPNADRGRTACRRSRSAPACRRPTGSTASWRIRSKASPNRLSCS